jgi:hypothetical protein
VTAAELIDGELRLAAGEGFEGPLALRARKLRLGRPFAFGDSSKRPWMCSLRLFATTFGCRESGSRDGLLRSRGDSGEHAVAVSGSALSCPRMGRY